MTASDQRASVPAGAVCARCRHFMNDPAALERAIPGLTAMGSAFASVRADDGICHRHERMVSPRDSCTSFEARRGD